MRTVSLAAVFLLFSACDAKEADVYALQFSVSDSAPLDEKPDRNAIPNFETNIPRAIGYCGAEFLAFDRAVTDGGEAAYFRLKPTHPDALHCIKSRIPSGNVRIAKRTDELNRLLEYEASR